MSPLRRQGLGLRSVHGMHQIKKQCCVMNVCVLVRVAHTVWSHSCLRRSDKKTRMTRNNDKSEKITIPPLGELVSNTTKNAPTGHFLLPQFYTFFWFYVQIIAWFNIKCVIPCVYMWQYSIYSVFCQRMFVNLG